MEPSFNSRMNNLIILCIILAISASSLTHSVNGFAINWGLTSTHPLPPNIVVKLLQDNGFNKVKLFEADNKALKALGNSGIQVMVGIPNNMLALLASNVENAINWVTQNVSNFVSHNGVDIRYVAVGNEPFLKQYGDKFIHTTLPALQNIQAAIIKAGLGSRVKATIPLNADVYQSNTGLPSAGDFRTDIHTPMINMIKYLSQNAAPVIVNIYPFLSLYADPNFPIDYAYFDGHNSNPIIDGTYTYTNVFEANYDTLISALDKNGFTNMTVIVGEVGWPTDADKNANPTNARRFNQGLINRIVQKKGTPKRPTNVPDVYLFSLLDEDAKSVDPGNFERHWGVFNYDGSRKYDLDLGSGKRLVGAKGVKYLEKKWCVLATEASEMDVNLGKSVQYACENSDCTSLGLDSSCGGLDVRSNASYAFNSYYQRMNQSKEACGFNGLGMITTVDPSKGACRFLIQIDVGSDVKSRGVSSSAAVRRGEVLEVVVGVVVGIVVSLFSFAG